VQAEHKNLLGRLLMNGLPESWDCCCWVEFLQTRQT